MPAVEVRRFLHCNYNVDDVEVIERFYVDVFGLRPVMRTENDGLDEGVAFGMYGPTSSRTSFIYDHRGGRYSNAFEAIQWTSPPTFGTNYRDPWFRGLHSMGYSAADLDATAVAVESHGGAVERRGDGWLLVRDPEHLPIEVHVADGESEGRYVRMVCTELDRTAAWWEELGFRPAELASVPGGEIWPGDAERHIRREQGMVGTDDPTFGILLTEWSGPQPSGPSYALPFHHGLFRMALAVDDVTAAHAALTELGVARQTTSHYRLPGTPLTDGLRILFLREPDNVIVELVERPRIGQRPAGDRPTSGSTGM